MYIAAQRKKCPRRCWIGTTTRTHCTVCGHMLESAKGGIGQRDTNTNERVIARYDRSGNLIAGEMLTEKFPGRDFVSTEELEEIRLKNWKDSALHDGNRDGHQAQE